MDAPYLRKLKQTLFEFPVRYDYQYSEQCKKDLRKILFLAVSCDGKYFDWLLPKLYSQTGDVGVVMLIFEKNANWLFTEYDQWASATSLDKSRNSHDANGHDRNLPCARVFRRGEPIYKCSTCGLDETCALCSHCFHPEQHEGHSYVIAVCQRENGGVCDCGDPEAWINEFRCRNATENVQATDFASRTIPDELQHSFSQTICILLNYVIDVMSQSDVHFHPSFDVAMYPEKFVNSSMLDPKKYGYSDFDAAFDRSSPKYSLIAYNDQIRHFRDTVQRVHLASKKVPEFAAMVAEQIHKNGRAVVIRSKDVSLLCERQKILSATGLTTCIRNTRDEFRETMCHDILLWLGNLLKREMVKSNGMFQNLLCHAFASKWNKGLLSTGSNAESEIATGRLDPVFNIPKVLSIPEGNLKGYHWFFNPGKWTVSPELCQSCGFEEAYSDPTSKSFWGSRFQYMVYLDIRFWKSIRVLLHFVYATSLITNLSYKSMFCCQYVDIYPSIADMFLTLDGEPEINMMSTLSTQLFTCPSITSMIVAHGDVAQIFSSIHNFLRRGDVTFSAIHPFKRNTVLISSLKNRRWGQIFFDIGYILSRGRDKELILTNSLIPMVCDILSLFQGKPAMKREKENHVEYENSDYAAFFHAILVVYQISEYVAHSLTNLEPETRLQVSQRSISFVLYHILELETIPRSNGNPDSNEVDYGTPRECTQDVLHEGRLIDDFTFSFLHPLHSFLSWLVEFSNFSTSFELFTVFSHTFSKFGADHPTFGDIDACLSAVFEYPIRTIVLSAQIKSMFWVRNGFSVRSQLQLYKNTSLREQGYLRDLYLVQIFALCSSPDAFMRRVLTLWRLNNTWLDTPDELASPYEPTVLSNILEECFNFFIQVLTEDSSLRGLTSEETMTIKIKNEIIHNLCFGPLSYSKLCTQIPEHIVCDKRFDGLLETLATFKRPASAKDKGVHVLKEAYIEEVNPYYFNYTLNKKDDCMKFLKEHYQKKNIPPHKIFIKPKMASVENSGIYQFVGTFVTSGLLRDFIIKGLLYVSKEGTGKMEGLLETILHFTHICALEQRIDHSFGNFLTSLTETSSRFHISLSLHLYSILCDEAVKSHHSKIRAIFDIFKNDKELVLESISRFVDDVDPTKLELEAVEVNQESEHDRKKRLAKQRQLKLLAKFKKQQNLFMEKNTAIDCGSDKEMEDLETEGWKFPEPHCILCQDTTGEAGPFGVVTYLFKSSEFREVPFDDPYWVLKSFSDKTNLHEHTSLGSIPEYYSEKWQKYMEHVKEENVFGPGFTNHNRVQSNIVSQTCGHGMHFKCYIQYLASSRARLNQITRNSPDSVEHMEFLCPLCKAICNMFIPILWTANNRSLKKFVSEIPNQANPLDLLDDEQVRNPEWFGTFCRESVSDQERFSTISPLARDMIGPNVSDLDADGQQQFKHLLSNMFETLSLLTFPSTFKVDSPLALINSIKSTEIALRGTESNSSLLIYLISNNLLINLRALNEFRATGLLMKSSNWVHSLPSQDDAHIKALSHFQALTMDYFNDSIFFSDFFSLLVKSFPVPSMGLTFNLILRTCFLGAILQKMCILVNQIIAHNFYSNGDFSILDIPRSEMISEDDARNGRLLFRMFHPVNGSLLDDETFGHVFYSLILKSVTPFLRQAAIYAFVCCSNTDMLDETSPELLLEANVLCKFLQIPSLGSMVAQMLTDGTAENSRLQKLIDHIRKTGKTGVMEEHGALATMEYPGVIRLIDLPERLDHFFTHYYYLDKYNSPYLTIEHPAICLFCGSVVDIQKGAIGSSYGQCTAHFTLECPNGIGIFLLPKEKSFLLLHKNGGSFYEAPYLDQHGELIGENKKGRTAHLLLEKYEDFTKKCWLTHNIANYIVRKLDSVVDAGGWDTL